MEALNDFFWLLIIYGIPGLLSSLLAALMCRHYLARHWRPSVWIALASAIGGPLLFPFFWFTIADRDFELFTAEFWMHDSGKGGRNAVLGMLALYTAICLVPATLSVIFYQRKWSSAAPVSPLAH